MRRLVSIHTYVALQHAQMIPLLRFEYFPFPCRRCTEMMHLILRSQKVTNRIASTNPFSNLIGVCWCPFYCYFSWAVLCWVVFCCVPLCFTFVLELWTKNVELFELRSIKMGLNSPTHKYSNELKTEQLCTLESPHAVCTKFVFFCESRQLEFLCKNGWWNVVEKDTLFFTLKIISFHCFEHF